MRSRNLLSCAALLILCAAVSACGDAASATTQTNDTAATVAETVTETETEETRLKANVPDSDFGGYEFRILHWYFDEWAARACSDLTADSETGDVLNDAVYARNLAVEDKYNCRITSQEMDYSELPTYITRAVTAGEDVCDLAYIRLYEAKSMVTGGYFMNFLDIPYIDMSQPWWDSNCSDALTYDGKLYFAASDINVEDKNATAAILFNKEIASNYDLEDMYALVRDGKWTMDKMKEIYSKVTTDINGDGVMDETDLWGFLGANDVADCFYLGGEGTFISTDENGNLYDSFNTDYNVSLTMKIQELMSDTVNFYNHHTGTQNAASTDDNEYRDLFSGGHGLFFWSRLDEVTTLRSLETDFGILPTPKYDEAQENYHSLVSQHITALMTVPATATDPERTGIILEALAAESKYTVQPAYYEVALKSKYLRDDDSAAMLDLIFATRRYDLGEIYGFGDWSTDGFIAVCRNSSKGVVASYEKKANAIAKALTKYVEAIQELE